MPVRNRLSTTCSGVRTHGLVVNTAATVAILFRLTFCPLVSRAVGRAPSGLTMGTPLPSTAATKMGPAPGRVPDDVKVSGRIHQQVFQAALGNRQAGEVGDAINGFLEGTLHRRLDQRLCNS